MIGHYSIQHGTNRELKALKADYNKTVEQVYTDVAVRALKSDTESLITLASVQHMTIPSRKTQSPNSDPSLNGHHLPSWVSDWRTYQSHILSEPTSPHRASGMRTPDLRIDESSQILRVRGILVDTIEACSDGLKPKSFHIGTTTTGSTPDDTPAIERLWRDICGHSAFDLSKLYVNGDAATLAYTQTLSSGPRSGVSEQDGGTEHRHRAGRAGCGGQAGARKVKPGGEWGVEQSCVCAHGEGVLCAGAEGHGGGGYCVRAVRGEKCRFVCGRGAARGSTSWSGSAMCMA
jgi:hypothetical protein